MPPYFILRAILFKLWYNKNHYKILRPRRVKSPPDHEFICDALKFEVKVIKYKAILCMCYVALFHTTLLLK